MWYCLPFMSRALALALLMAVVVSWLPAQTRWAANEDRWPRVGVFLDFDSVPSASSLEAMKREVGLALNPSGAQFFWLMLKTDTKPETFDHMAVMRFRGSCQAGKLKPVDRRLGR